MSKEEKIKSLKIGSSEYLLLPENLKSDSSFPLNLEKELSIKIVSNKIVIENIKEEDGKNDE